MQDTAGETRRSSWIECYGERRISADVDSLVSRVFTASS